MKISVHIDEFKQEMKRRNFSENSIKNYVACLNVFFAQSKSDHPKNIHEREIKEFLVRFNTPNTQRNYHSAIKKYFEVVLGQKDKFKYIPYARKERKLPIVLSVAEIQRMFSVCGNIKHKCILGVLYGCGLRVSELINLKWKHIDRHRMVINVVCGKGKKDKQVPLPDGLLHLLESYCRLYKLQSTTYVFSGQFGEQYSSMSVGKVIKSLAKKAGIGKRVYTHLIRHCTGTHLVENGTDINLIQKIFGHSSVKTTAIYTHISHNIISKINSPINQIAL